MEPESEQPPQRPAFLTRLMEAEKNKMLKEDFTYETFLSEAEVANRTNISSPHVAINMTGNVLPLGIVKKRANANRSLELIFYFYSRLQDSAAQLATEGPTFEQILWASNTISFQELALFCRDFSIIPTLLSKDELRFIWRVTAPQWEGNLDQRSCRFCDFPDMLVRVAVVAYNKPVMKALLIEEHGFMPADADLVQALCTYIKLDEMDWVKHRIATVGRETMKSLNFRSVGEVNEHVKEDLRNEVAGRRLAKFMAKGASEKEASGRSTRKTYAINKDGKGGDESLNKDGSESGDKQVQKVTSKPQLNATSRSADAKEAGPLENAGSKAMASKTSLSESNDMMRSKEAEEMSFLDQMFAEARSMDAVTLDGDGAKTAVSVATSARKKRQQAESADRNIITVEQEQALLRVDRSLSNILRSYSQIYSAEMLESSSRNKVKASHCDDPDEDPHFIASGSSFLDMGCIPMSSKVTVSLKLTNKGNDDMLFDVVTREMDDQNAVLKVMPSAIAPGLHRTVKLYLEPVPKDSCGGRCIIGYIDIFFKYKRSSAPLECMSCPVYYKIAHKEEKHINNKDNTGHIIPRCTTKTMARILHKYGVDTCPLFV